MDLLERTSQLSDLERCLHGANNGAGRLVVIGGEAGIGKTALLSRLVEQVPDSVCVLIGACDALSAPRPLGPLFDIASTFGDQFAQMLHDPARRPQLFNTVLDALTAQGPALVVIEDMHWADEATLDLLRYLGRRIDKTRALLIITYRDDEVTAEHPFRRVLGDLGTVTSVARLTLHRLSERAVGILSESTPFDSRELHRRTGGNPFYLTEVLASGASSIPTTVRDAVLTRAARLSPGARAALEAAAVIGAHVNPRLLAEVIDHDADAVDECLAVGLLLTTNGELQFRHQLAQQVVLEALSPMRAARLHRKVLAACLARSPAADELATVAHHAEAAGDASAVLEFAPAAANRAAELGAHREAAAQFA